MGHASVNITLDIYAEVSKEKQLYEIDKLADELDVFWRLYCSIFPYKDRHTCDINRCLFDRTIYMPKSWERAFYRLMSVLSSDLNYALRAVWLADRLAQKPVFMRI